MPKGRRCRTLTPHQIARLEKIRHAGDRDHRNGYTYAQMKHCMNGSFKLDTFLRAIDGKPIWERYHAYIVEWLDRFYPEKPVRDAKAAAAGEKGDSEDIQDEDEGGETGPTGTIRGSR